MGVAETPSGSASGAPNRALAEQHLQQGLDHYDRQEIDAALASYRAAIEADPAFAMGYNNLGMVLIDVEQYEDAQLSLVYAIQCDPSYAEAYNNLGFMLRRVGRNVEAASAYTRYLELEPDLEEAPRIRSWIETVKRDNGLAELPAFETLSLNTAAPAAEPEPAPAPQIQESAAPAIAPAPQDPSAAATAARLSGVPVAAQEPQEPVKTVPQPAEVVQPAEAVPAAPLPSQDAGAPLPGPLLAGAQPRTVMPAPGLKPAVQPLHAAPALTPQDVTALVERGLDQFAEGEFAGAAATFQQAVALEPDNAEAHIGLGKVLMRQEKTDEALAELQRALSIAPNDPAALYVLGFGLRALDRNEEAAEAYTRFLESQPEALDAAKIRQWIETVRGAAGAGAGGGGDEAAVIDDEQIVTDADRKYKQAAELYQEGKLDNAFRQCVAILNEDRAHVRTRVLLGRVFLRQKNYDGAVEQLEGALVARPDYAEALYFLGQACEKKGQADKAAISFTRYLEIAPQGPRAERLRTWLAKQMESVAPAAPGKMLQCELCLRFFDEKELTPHEGKATCRNCLAVMGAAPVLAPTMMKETALEPSPVLVQPASGTEPAVKVKRRASPVSLVLACMAVMLAVVVLLKTFYPVFSNKKPPVRPGPAGMDPENDIAAHKPKFDASGIKLVNAPAGEAWPCARWSFTPELSGLERFNEIPNAVVKIALGADAPVGMSVTGNTVAWTPPGSDAAELLKGWVVKTELTVKGVDGNGRELFVLNRPLALNVRFGYEMGSAVDLGIGARESVALAALELNGGQRRDLAAVSGDYRKGAVRIYVQRPDTEIPVPTQLLAGARFSAVVSAGFAGQHSGDLLVANWHTGEVQLFRQSAQQPVRGAALKAGAGPVALAASASEVAGQTDVAVLLGLGQALVMTSLQADHTFGPVTEIPLPCVSAPGFVFPWRSAEAGTGFAAVLPLGEEPVVFAARNKDSRGQGGALICSKLEDPGLIVAAAVLRGSGARPQRLALLVEGHAHKLMMLEEKGGRFVQAGKPLVVSSAGAGLLACDFNRDGQDDLFVVGQESSGFYFVDPSGDLQPGPQMANPVRMLGPAVVFRQLPNGPELLLVDADRKGHLLRPVEESAAAKPGTAPNAAPNTAPGTGPNAVPGAAANPAAGAPKP